MYVLKIFQFKKPVQILQSFSNEEVHVSGKLKVWNRKEEKKQLSIIWTSLESLDIMNHSTAGALTQTYTN